MFDKRSKKIILFVASIIGLLSAGIVFAQGPVDQTAFQAFAQEAGFGGAADIRVIIARIIRTILTLGGIALVSIIIYGGFVLMAAGGREQEITKGKKIIINGFIGLLIALASFSITQFVLSRLVEAIGGGTSVTVTPPPCPGCPVTLPPGTFVVESFSPIGQLPIKNVTAQVRFNSNVDPATGNVSAIKIKSGNKTGPVVPVSYVVSGKDVYITPTKVCVGFENEHCLEANSPYTIVVEPSLKSALGTAITCGLSIGCNSSFTTGDKVDITPPAVLVTAPDDGENVQAGYSADLQARVTDDAGVGITEFFVDNVSVDSDGPTGAISPLNFDAFGVWDTGQVVPGTTHSILAQARDIAGHIARSAPIEVEALAAHCFTNAKDLDETGVDCGGADCDACSGGVCENNGECASGVCEDGICVEFPRIDSVSPDSGAEGTFVTVSGVFFGTAPGYVEFLGADGDNDNVKANNAACLNSWTPTQVTVEVPDGAVSGPIAIVLLPDKKSDSTDNSFGTLISDFEVNNVIRPGLCSLNPSSGLAGTTITGLGKNFNDLRGSSAVFFMDSENSFEAASYPIWSNEQIRFISRQIAANRYKVRAVVNGVTSNALSFTVLPTTISSSPVISSVDSGQTVANSGPVGQYITISGNNFGSSVGLVLFRDADGTDTYADFNFPAQCPSTWTDTQITAKVPSAAIGEYKIFVDRSGDRAISNKENFTIASGAAGPSICAIDPQAGPVGTSVEIIGERFGSGLEGDLVKFWNNISAATPTSWENDEINASVPDGAQTGPIKVVASGLNSNPVNFTVGNCQNDPDICATGSVCCDNGTCDAVAPFCKNDAKSSTYTAHFSTGPIIRAPRVVVECSARYISPSPYSGHTSSVGSCINAIVTAAFDSAVPVDPSTINSGTVIVQECVVAARGEEPCKQVNATIKTGSFRTTPTSFGFMWTPYPRYGTNKWHRVTLKGGENGIKALGTGIPLANDFTWNFKTRESSVDCITEGINILPPEQTIKEESSKAVFNAAAICGNGCQICDINPPIPYTWNVFGGHTHFDTNLSRSPENVITDDSATSLVAYDETGPTQPDRVNASVGVIINGNRVNKNAYLYVEYIDPKIESWTPSCNDACVNAAITANFTISMLPSSFANNVTLYRCADSLCNVGLTAVSTTTSLTEEDKVLNILPENDLLPSAFYRVIISSNVKSENNVALTGLNYNNSFSWIFGTKSDTALCGIDRVDMSPQSILVKVVGERGTFTAKPYGSPDSCSAAGQLLNGFSYPWSWEVEKVANVDIASITSINTTINLPEGCSSSCLNTGTIPGVSVCGNGVKEFGEDCDLGTSSSAGCSALCLHEGFATVAQGGLCGDGDIDAYGSLTEECDDGNAVAGDGCSALCLREGARASGTVCGDGTIVATPKGGEECDDGNAASGDGCSEICLNEGSLSSIIVKGVCGNGGEPEAGEDCDDDNDISGDGCSRNCLREGSASISAVCGNSQVDRISAGGGEDCDDGNRTSGDGCSSNCLKEGSSDAYAMPSYCGDGGAIGVGEECEASAADSYTDPVQTVTLLEEAVAQVNQQSGIAQTDINATDGVYDKTGTAQFGISCSCQTDLSCGVNTDTIGCGFGGCCVVRPTLDRSASTPSGSSSDAVCRNTLVSAVFDREMNESSFAVKISQSITENKIVLEYLGSTNPSTPFNCPSSYLAHFDSAGGSVEKFGFFWSIINPIASKIKSWTNDFVGMPVFAQVPRCLVPVDLQSAKVGSATSVSLAYKELLLPNSIYRVAVAADADLTDNNNTSVVQKGVASKFGATIKGDVVERADFETSVGFEFRTGTEVCLLDLVRANDTSDSPGLFTTAGEQHSISATAVSVRGAVTEQIVPIPGVYDWSWSGQEPNVQWGWYSTIPDSSTTTENILIATPPASVSANPNVAVARTATPAVNGSESIVAEARIISDTLNTPSTAGRIVSGQVMEKVMLCENPWPQVGHFPFKDTQTGASDLNANGLAVGLDDPFTNFSTYYCRDAGDANRTNDDLPRLNIVQPEDPAGTGVFKELLFIDPGTGEAVGVRVAENLEYLKPADWFASKGFVGSPQNESLDGYEGARDGRTLYVNSANTATEAFSNIYAIAYSEDAGENVQNIYGQMLANWSFNANDDAYFGAQISNNRVCKVSDAQIAGNYITPLDSDNQPFACTSDFDCEKSLRLTHLTNTIVCDAQKDKLSRDTRRLSDLRTISNLIKEYGNENRHCSVTKNQSCLTNGNCPGSETCVASVPTIEAGSFIRSFTTSAWPSWQSQFANALGSAVPSDPVNEFIGCPAGSDPLTCFNSTSSNYVCPFNSKVYSYKNIGQESYVLSADFELAQSGTKWRSAIDSVLDNFEIKIGNASAPAGGGFYTTSVCDSVSIGNSAKCGDGILGVDPPEACELGQVSTASCNVSVCRNTATPSMNGKVCADATSISACTNSGGTCENTSGIINVACKSDCSGFEGAVSSVSQCVPLICGNGVLDANENCDDGVLNGVYGYCGLNCSLSGAIYCGDGKKSGGEACDCGANSNLKPTSCVAVNGVYNSNPANSCAFDCSGPASHCGDRIINGGEVCDGGTEKWEGKLCTNGNACETDDDCSDNLTCGSGDVACPVGTARFRQCNSPSQVNACGGFDGWSTCVADCGNGKVEGDEQCDDGNSNNNDTCANECVQNICGDGKRLVGVEACDFGTTNGESCQAPYAGTCNFCTEACLYQTVSGGYCGDNVINGSELCDRGNVLARCYKGDGNPASREIGGVCDSDSNCTISGFECAGDGAGEILGACNGGSKEVNNVRYEFNGKPCVVGPTDNNKTCGVTNAQNNTVEGVCEPVKCNATCSTTCPFNWSETGALIQSELLNVPASESIDIYGYLSGNSPDTASIEIPACRVGTSLTATVNFNNIDYPSVDIVFLTDLSRSMGDEIDGTPKITLIKDTLTRSVNSLFEKYTKAPLRVGLAIFAGFEDEAMASNNYKNLKKYDFTNDLNQLENIIGGFSAVNNNTQQYGTPLKRGLETAEVMFDNSQAQKKYLVVFSDGDVALHTSDPGLPQDDALGSGKEKYVYQITQAIDGLKEKGVEIFTVQIPKLPIPFLCYNRSFDRWSSQSCNLGNYPSCIDFQAQGRWVCADNETNGVKYSYKGSTVTELSAVFETIVQNISSMSLLVQTQSGVTAGALLEGPDVTLPFPDGFACPDGNGPFNLPIRVNFSGQGTIRISDIKFDYCAK